MPSADFSTLIPPSLEYGSPKANEEISLGKTVRRYLRLYGEQASRSKSPIPTAGFPGRRSDCEPFRRQIEDMAEQGLSAQRIWQDLSCLDDFTASYQSVKRFVRGLTDSGELPFRRMESAPGSEAQVDFGTGAPVIGADGRQDKWLSMIRICSRWLVNNLG